jgi:hypothetical protein
MNVKKLTLKVDFESWISTSGVGVATCQVANEL